MKKMPRLKKRHKWSLQTKFKKYFNSKKMKKMQKLKKRLKWSLRTKFKKTFNFN